MGCCTAIPLQEKVLLIKESSLQFNRLTADEIYNAFKVTEDSPILTYPLVKEILRKMNLIYTESEEKILLQPFILLFRKETIHVEEEKEIDPRSLSAAMVLMCKSNEKSKAKALFEIFDEGNNNSLGLLEFNYMIRKLLISVDNITNILLGEIPEKNDNFQNIKDEIVFEIFS